GSPPARDPTRPRRETSAWPDHSRPVAPEPEPRPSVPPRRKAGTVPGMPSTANAATTRYVALLRGINVGGHAKVAMAQLRHCVAGLGFEDVRTLLQSGNLVFGGK